MDYTVDEVMKYIEEEDGKFIRLAFRDALGVQKNISVMPGEIRKAFVEGIPVNARAIAGFGNSPDSLLYLKPDASTLTVLPWRPDSGRVLRMFCDVVTPDGKPYGADSREILRLAAAEAKEAGIEFRFGSKAEFYLFKKDDEGNPTKIPYDQAGYMDIAPLDKCENVRREISLTIEKMGLTPERSHHERGPGQNEIDFHYGKPLKAADQLTTFKMVVSTVADRNGLVADFSPKPLAGKPGNGYQIDIYISDLKWRTDKTKTDLELLHGTELAGYALAGILEKYKDIMIFLNPQEESYAAAGEKTSDAAGTQEKTSGASDAEEMPVLSGTADDRHGTDTSICIRNHSGKIRLEFRLSGAHSNPYLIYALLIHAGLYGIRNRLKLPADWQEGCRNMPQFVDEVRKNAKNSEFVNAIVPQEIIDQYTKTESDNR